MALQIDQINEVVKGGEADQISLLLSSSFVLLKLGVPCRRDAPLSLALVHFKNSLQNLLFRFNSSSVSNAAHFQPRASSSADYRLVSLCLDCSWCRHVEA